MYGMRRCLITVFLLFAGACSGPPEEPLRVGTNIWPGYESLYLARSLELYPQKTIHLVELPSATAVLQTLAAGALDAACLTLDEALAARARGLDLQIILVMDISAGGDVLLVRPPIKSLAELRGKTIAVENTAVGAILLDGALQAAGLQVDDVILKFTSVDEHEQAYTSGEVDAVVTFEPVRSRLLTKGAQQLFDSSQIPERIVDVLVVSRKVAGTRASQLQTLVKAHFAALDYRREHTADANRRMAPRHGVTPDQMAALFNGIIIPGLAENRRLLSGNPPPLEETARQLIAVMYRAGLLRNNIDVTGMMQPRFLPEAGR